MSVVFQRVPFKRILFRLHWIAGLAAGVVLAIVGFTGGLIGFEEPLLKLANPALQVAANGRGALTPERWIESARAAHPDLAVRGIAWSGTDEPVNVRMTRGKDRGVQVAVDPYDARVLGVPRGAGFFEGAERLHRTLAAGPVGKQIVGASTAMLIVLALSGFYLRWTRRRVGSLSSWFLLDFKLKGRMFLWQLHAVVGTWLLVFYLVAAFTGLWWSYDFYRNAVNQLAGVDTPMRRPPAPVAEVNAPMILIDRAWAAFRQQVPDAMRANVALPARADTPLEIRYQTPASPHERAWDSLKLDPASGAIVSRERYADLPRGRRLVFSLFPLHSGSFLGMPGRVLMALASLLMPLFAITGIWLWLWRRRNEAARRVAVRTPVGIRGLAADMREPDAGPA